VSRLADAWRALTRAADLGPLDAPNRSRRAGNGGPLVTQESALRNSVWWAGTMLRANLVSTFPVDVVRATPDGLLKPVANPGPLVSEPWPDQDITEFQFSTQMDKDRYGNAVGIIRERNALGKPTAVELQSMANVSATMDGGRVVEWRCGNSYYDPRDIWHEKQYTMAGFGLGLNPMQYASSQLGIYDSAQAWAADWFAGGAQPKGDLKNTEKSKLGAKEAQEARDKFRETTRGGDIFVHGVEWEWTPAETSAATSGFLEQQESSEQAICRFIGVPAMMVGVDAGTGNITYANVTQANLQFLIMHLQPSIVRTERYWSRKALPAPWQFKLNTDALLRLDPQGKADLMVKLNTQKLRTPTELRRLDNLGPYDDDQMSELGTFAQLGKPVPSTTPTQLSEAPTWLVPS
jgi:HK97 family phage portal protein